VAFGTGATVNHAATPVASPRAAPAPLPRAFFTQPQSGDRTRAPPIGLAPAVCGQHAQTAHGPRTPGQGGAAARQSHSPLSSPRGSKPEDQPYSAYGRRNGCAEPRGLGDMAARVGTSPFRGFQSPCSAPMRDQGSAAPQLSYNATNITSPMPWSGSPGLGLAREEDSPEWAHTCTTIV
jgi:hypothetical protein